MVYPILFIFAVVLAFFIPGDLLVKQLKLKFPQRIVISTVLGISLWALQGLLFGFLNIRFFSYIYLIFSALIWIGFNFNDIKKFRCEKISLKRIDFFLGGIIMFGVLLQMSAVYSIASKTNHGLFFCCRSVPDSIYQLSLTNELIKNFPPQEPGMAGVTVKNYHFLSNLTVAEMSRIFKLPIENLQFRYMSFLISFMVGASILTLASILNLKKTLAICFLLFTYFSGDILYILFLLQSGVPNFQMTVLDDASLLQANPTRAFSMLLLLGGLSLLAIYTKMRNLYSGFLMAVVMGSLIGFKVYTGIFALTGFGLLGFHYLIKKNLRLIGPLLPIAVLSLIIYLPFNSNAGGLIFTGFWRFENFIASPGISLQHLELSRLIFLRDGKYHIVLLFETLFIAIYFLALFGTKNLAFFQTKKSLSYFPLEMNVFLIGGLLTSIILGLFFIQKTGGANTVQFLINASLIASFYTALATYSLLRKVSSTYRFFLALLIITFTVPRSLYQGFDSLKQRMGHKGYEVTNEQLEAYHYLREKTPKESVVILPKNYADSEETLHIPYLSNRAVYLAGVGVLKDHGHDTGFREEIISKVYGSTNSQVAYSLLKENNIDYLFLSKKDISKLNDPASSEFLPTVFENGTFKIIKVVNEI